MSQNDIYSQTNKQTHRDSDEFYFLSLNKSKEIVYKTSKKKINQPTKHTHKKDLKFDLNPSDQETKKIK